LLSNSQFRVLVVRLGAMGDILHALPAVTALRAAHPEWQIDWVVEPRWVALLAASGDRPELPRSEQRPLVDRIIFAPTKKWGKRPFSFETLGEVRALRRQLRAAKYDAVIDLQGAIKSAVVSAMTGSNRVIGHREPREGAARWFYDEFVPSRALHVIEQALDIAGRITSEYLPFQTAMLPVSAEAEKWCDERLADTAGKKLVLINPGAGWGAKCWPWERYAEVANALTADGCQVLLNAGPGEEELAGRIASATDGKACTIVCTIEQLIALTRRISLLIAGDTGPLHLACALRKPVVGIYGPTESGRNGPYGTRYKVLRNRLSKRDHRRLQETEAGLLKIEAANVLGAAEELLN
jgi:heptosyltransferase-1